MGEQEYVVQMKGITKVYPNGVAANQGVDFNVKRGEIHALMGENGAGKSTLMKMLFGLEQPTEGEISVKRNAFFTNGCHFQRDWHGTPAFYACAEPDGCGKHGAWHGTKAEIAVFGLQKSSRDYEGICPKV